MIPHRGLLEEQVRAMPHPMLFATVSGAHLYGFASPDSDVDLRGVHVLPAVAVLGLESPNETITLEEVVNGVEIDLVSHDARKFFQLLLKRNGYVLEQVLSPLVVHSSDAHQELIGLAKGCITRHHVHHYKGFAHTEWELFLKEPQKRVKPLLYVYRVLLTGIHLMRTGELIAHLPTLASMYGHAFLEELIREKVEGKEKEVLQDARLGEHQRNFESLMNELVRSGEESSLPDKPSSREGLNDLLVRLRLGSLERK